MFILNIIYLWFFRVRAGFGPKISAGYNSPKWRHQHCKFSWTFSKLFSKLWKKNCFFTTHL